MARRFCASSRAAATRLHLAKKLATRCCAGAPPGFLRTCMARRQRRPSSRKKQLSVVSRQFAPGHGVILSGGGAGLATPESKDPYFGKQSPYKHFAERLAPGRMPHSGLAREEAGRRSFFSTARIGLPRNRDSVHRNS